MYVPSSVSTGETTFSISGIATGSGSILDVKIIAPNGNIISIDQLLTDSDGSFTSTIGVSGQMWQQTGYYEVQATYGSLQESF